MPTEAAGCNDETFLRDVLQNDINAALLSRWTSVNLPDAWLVAGCLFQTVWNLKAGRPPDSGIKDYDVFYYDPADLSQRGEQQAQALVQDMFSDLGVTIEVANQARVHLWYETHFGRPYPRLTTCEDGINRFLIRETCVAVRPDRIYAPYGLSGIYAGTLSKNLLTPYPELFSSKVASYLSRWQWLKIVDTGSPASRPMTESGCEVPPHAG